MTEHKTQRVAGHGEALSGYMPRQQKTACDNLKNMHGHACYGLQQITASTTFGNTPSGIIALRIPNISTC